MNSGATTQNAERRCGEITETRKRAEKLAETKLKSIIDREGTAGGERLKPYYFECLVQEIEKNIQIEKKIDSVFC